MDFYAIGLSLFHSYGLVGLFIILFLSASLLPFPSEPFLILGLKFWSPYELFALALVASTLSAAINYYVGLKGVHFFLVDRDPKGERKAEKWFAKWGWPVLLASPWIPFIGDLMPVVAGTLNMGWKKFLIVIVAARSIKTIAVLWFGVFLLKFLGL